MQMPMLYPHPSSSSSSSSYAYAHDTGGGGGNGGGDFGHHMSAFQSQPTHMVPWQNTSSASDFWQRLIMVHHHYDHQPVMNVAVGPQASAPIISVLNTNEQDRVVVAIAFNVEETTASQADVQTAQQRERQKQILLLEQELDDLTKINDLRDKVQALKQRSQAAGHSSADGGGRGL